MFSVLLGKDENYSDKLKRDANMMPINLHKMDTTKSFVKF